MQESIATEEDNLVGLVQELSTTERQALIEALLFSNGSPLTISKLADATGIPADEVKDIIESIQMKCSLVESGIECFEFDGKYQLRSKALYGPFIQQLRASRPKKLSQQALETLAIIAYRQPIVKSDIEVIRGVDATPTIKTLIEKGFVKIVGHQASVGQPALYGTTPRFLEIFGLSSLAELPTLRDLREFDREPGESVESQSLEDNQAD
jgi:segregation and condensation protein B